MANLFSIPCIFTISLFGVLFIPAQLHADAIPDNPPRSPVSHITDAMLSKDGSFWITGENASIYRLPPGSKDAYSWENMKYFNGFPDTSDFRSLAQDLQGRIWAGTDNCGVAVFNGVEWKTYNRENALCGDHVVDIAVSPITGEVALATSGGITIYNPVSEHWKYLTRAEGLISDQVNPWPSPETEPYGWHMLVAAFPKGLPNLNIPNGVPHRHRGIGTQSNTPANLSRLQATACRPIYATQFYQCKTVMYLWARAAAWQSGTSQINGDISEAKTTGTKIMVCMEPKGLKNKKMRPIQKSC